MMSEKIVLTVEQGESVKKIIKDGLNLSQLSFYEGRFNSKHESLNNLTIDQFARILYEPNSYEVEQPAFELGDWVTRLSGNINQGSQFAEGRTFKVVKAPRNRVTVADSDDAFHATITLRHATKEEIFWAELGREVGEFVEGDVVVFDDDSSCRIEPMYPHTIISIKGKYKKGEVVGLYPANSFIEFP